MKNTKKVVIIVALVATLGISGAVFAGNVKNPAEIISGLTGKKVEDVNAQRDNGKTYGTIAKESGKLEEFKTQIMEQKRLVLDERVKDGKLTKERADQILNNIKERQATCDGTGQENQEKCGMGRGRGNGNGFGMRNGQCMMNYR